MTTLKKATKQELEDELASRSILEDEFRAAVSAHFSSINQLIEIIKIKFEEAKNIADSNGIPFMFHLDEDRVFYIPKTYHDKYSEGLDYQLTEELCDVKFDSDEEDEEQDNSSWNYSSSC